MAEYFTYYKLTEEEKENIKKTCETLFVLEKNTTLNANFNLSLVQNLLELIIANDNNKMKL